MSPRDSDSDSNPLPSLVRNVEPACFDAAREKTQPNQGVGRLAMEAAPVAGVDADQEAVLRGGEFHSGIGFRSFLR